MNTQSRFLNKYLFLAFAGLVLFTTSCKKDKGPEPEVNENITINEWVTENMRIYYYWNKTIPSDRQLDFELGPIDFFETVLNPADRFSWIAKSVELEEQLGGVSTSTGMQVSLMGYNYDGKAYQNILGTVRYVIPNSPADKKGVKRGMLFTSVNGTKLTPDNYVANFANLYDDGKGFKITIATLANNMITETSTVIDLSAARVEEPSVYMSKVINAAGGKKVGYIFYNTFLNSKADEVFNAFNELKTAGVTDLILDLRYNLGGGISIAGVMAALIKKDYNKDEIFVKYNYNDDLNRMFDSDPDESRDENFKKLFAGVVALGENPTDQQKDAAAVLIDGKVIAANLDLPKVYILATGNSASASELVIHNLAPYMEVIHIGETTIGKNEGSITIKDERTPKIIDWAIQPIIVKLADKNGEGDYDTGLAPDYLIDEFDTLPLLPLGDEADPLIAKALELIGSTPQSRSRMMQSDQGMKTLFPQLLEFNKKQIKPRPVQMDGAIDKKILEGAKEINNQNN